MFVNCQILLSAGWYQLYEHNYLYTDIDMNNKSKKYYLLSFVFFSLIRFYEIINTLLTNLGRVNLGRQIN